MEVNCRPHTVGVASVSTLMISKSLLLSLVCVLTSFNRVSGSLHFYAGSDVVTAFDWQAAERSGAETFDIYEFYRQYQAKKEEERKIQHEFLSLLGLKHRPKSHPGVVTSSAPRFLLQLYRHLELSDMDGGYSANDVARDVMTSSLLDSEAQVSDMIIAFVHDDGK